MTRALHQDPPFPPGYTHSDETADQYHEEGRVDNKHAILGVAAIWGTIIFLLLCIGALTRLFHSFRARIRMRATEDSSSMPEGDSNQNMINLEHTKVVLKNEHFHHHHADQTTMSNTANTTLTEDSNDETKRDNEHDEVRRRNGGLERFESIDLEWEGGDGSNFIDVPSGRDGKTESVSNLCAICLCSFKVNETIAWSPNPSCHLHVFHEDCIRQVLQRDTKCPICRQAFVLNESED